MPANDQTTRTAAEAITELVDRWKQIGFYSRNADLYVRAASELPYATSSDALSLLRQDFRSIAHQETDDADRLAQAADLIRGMGLDSITAELVQVEVESRERAEIAEQIADDLDEIEELDEE